jgi:hypothetical protein
MWHLLLWCKKCWICLHLILCHLFWLHLLLLLVCLLKVCWCLLELLCLLKNLHLKCWLIICLRRLLILWLLIWHNLDICHRNQLWLLFYLMLLILILIERICLMLILVSGLKRIVFQDCWKCGRMEIIDLRMAHLLLLSVRMEWLFLNLYDSFMHFIVYSLYNISVLNSGWRAGG